MADKIGVVTDIRKEQTDKIKFKTDIRKEMTEI